MPEWIRAIYRMVLKYGCPTNKIFVHNKSVYYVNNDSNLQEYINELAKK